VRRHEVEPSDDFHDHGWTKGLLAFALRLPDMQLRMALDDPVTDIYVRIAMIAVSLAVGAEVSSSGALTLVLGERR
jgi:hypothetical protein